MKHTSNFCNNTYFIIAILVALLTGCQISSSEAGQSTTDSLTFNEVSQHTIRTIPKSDGKNLKEIATIRLQLPSQLGDSSKLHQLQQLILSTTLEVNDSAIVDTPILLNDFLANYLSQNAPTVQDLIAGVEDTDDPELNDNELTQFEVLITVKPVYNKNGLLSVCKHEVIKKNTKVSSVTSTYYNFNIHTMRVIDVSELLKEGSTPQVQQLLKTQLMKQKNVDTDDELVEAGYYNLSNLNVTNNFYFTDQGVIWSYQPNELAVYILGETQVLLSYEVIQPYLKVSPQQ